MGVVDLAQHSLLGREVAMKSLRSDQPSTRDQIQLLREAWVTSRLEHPNIVPLYQVGRDTHHNPVLVMKRISGTSFAELLSDPEHPGWPDGVHDTREWAIRVLIQVCNAVHFAHGQCLPQPDTSTYSSLSRRMAVLLSHIH